MSTKYIVNNVSGQTITGGLKINGIANYKALLTQTGPITGTSLNDFNYGLIIGETYTINIYENGDDFSNIADVQSGIINTSGCTFIATGETRTVREFLLRAFAEAGITIKFKGDGVDEKAYVTHCEHPDYQLPIGKEVVSIDPTYFRPTEVELLIGDATKAQEKLNWKPRIHFDELGQDMVSADLQLFRNKKFINEFNSGN